MKTIEIIRGGQSVPKFVEKDVFDSVINVLHPGGYQQHYKYVNTDFYIGYKGGILAEGDYAGICCNRKSNGKKVIYIFDNYYFDVVNSLEDLNEKNLTLRKICTM